MFLMQWWWWNQEVNELIVKKKNGHKDKCRNGSEENNWNESTNNHK